MSNKPLSPCRSEEICKGCILKRSCATKSGLPNCVAQFMDGLDIKKGVLDAFESPATGRQHTQAKMPSWNEITSGIIFTSVDERNAASEIYSRIARHFGCA